MFFFPGVNEEDSKFFSLQIYDDNNTEEEKIIVTGLINEEILDAVNISITLIKKINIKISKYIHIHFPDYNYYKVGISSSLCIFFSLYAHLTKKKIFHNKRVLLSGEIDLEGNLYEIGGIEKKLELFIDNDFDLFILPKKNKKNVVELNKTNKNIIYINNIYEIMKSR